MFNVRDILQSIFHSKQYVKLTLSELPSTGLFYTDGFEIKIKQAEESDIEEYNKKYIDGDFLSIISCIKWVIKNNIKLSKGHTFSSISSIDILYIFLEIVKLTKGKDIYVEHDGVHTKFCPENFNYFKIGDKYTKLFDSDNKVFVYDGFKYSLPTTGVESSLTRFLYDMSTQGRLIEFSEASYDFLYFLGGKTNLTNSEIENLIIIFNEELSELDKKTISKIVSEFRPFSEYSLKCKRGIIPLDAINLKHIWSI